jgi:hypothetical protein
VQLVDQVHRADMARARLVGEGLALVDVVTSSSNGKTGGAEVLALVDDVHRAMTFVRDSGTGFTPLDAATRGPFARPRSAGEVLLLGDQVRRVTSRRTSAGDFLGLNDLVRAGAIARVRMLAELVQLVDQLDRGTLVRPRDVAEAIAVGDQVARIMFRARAIAELVDLADAVLASRRNVPQGRITVSRRAPGILVHSAAAPRIVVTRR